MRHEHPSAEPTTAVPRRRVDDPARTAPDGASRPGGLDVRSVLDLQHRAGNRATGLLLARGAAPVQRRTDLDAEPISLPESTPLNLTGAYEALDPGGNNRITLQFNQAGYRLEGWYQRRESFSFASRQRQSMIQHRITADFVGEESGASTFRYRRTDSTGREVASGMLTARAAADGSPRLTLASDAWAKSFERTSTAARPPQEALDALPDGVREILVAAHTAPLDRDEHERLTSNLDVVEARIRAYWQESSAIAQMAPASAVNADIGTIFAQYADQQRPLVRQLVMEKLMLDTFTHQGNERSYWSWLQLLVIGQPGFTRTVQAELGFTAEGGSEQMRVYRYAINLAGLSGDLLLGGGVMGGVFEVEYLGTGPEAAQSTTPVWRRELAMGIVQVSGGASAGITTGLFTPWSTFETPYPWEPQNFNGPLLIGGVQASASAGPGGGGSAAMMTVWGDRSLPPLGLPGVSALAEVGLHAGVEAGGTAGWIGGTDAEIRANLDPAPPVRGDAAFSASGATHFEVDEPFLTADGIDEVRSLSALHLTTLESPGTVLRIDGYASTTGSDEHNRRLSLSRARHVLQQMKDVVPGFAIPQAQITLTGHGETAAREAGLADRTEDPAWRRVDIVIDGTIVLSLH